MGMPTVVDDRLVFVVADPDHDLRMVQLTVDDDLVDDHRFRRTSAGWTLVVPVPPVHRLEYRLLVTDGEGDSHVVLDPANPTSVATAFGRRSVAHLPDYVIPTWLGQPTVDPARTTRDVATPVGTVPVTTWAPSSLDDHDVAPLLVVHDGPEYDDLADLGYWAGAAIASGRLPAFRMALLRPVERDQWYTANPDWPDSVAAVVADLDGHHARTGSVVAPIVVMGASLGGLAALQVARAGVLDVGGVFSQSGSFFQPALDPQESHYPWFERITDWVDAVATDPPPDRHLDVVLTCGRSEENHANNVAMAGHLRDRGHRVTWQSLADLHNYTAWRDGLDPGLPDLLARQWHDRQGPS